jgi:hypothetical protein
MITPRQIERLVELQEYRQLVERILTNGRCRSRAALALLKRADVAAPAAIGLALQRLAEITYGPSDLANDLARRLIAMQRRDGMYGGGPNPSSESLIAATATALRGLLSCVSQQSSTNVAAQQPILQAIDSGVAALAKQFKCDAKVQHDAAAWAIALWQLGDEPRFRQAVPVPELLNLLDTWGTDVLEDELCRYALAMAA